MARTLHPRFYEYIKRMTSTRSEKLVIPDFACMNELTVPCTEVLQGGYDMEGPSPSERATVVRRDDDRDPVCHGV